ncbi:helix-turn-helix transcriptional regulator [Pontiella desulfatans]|nr:PocR ligand-binding domain-containing protein [Pontiella desulfatans]
MHHTISQKVSEIFDLYTELHDIRISLFGPDGKLIYPDSVGRPNCPHCIMLRETLGLDSKCRDLDHEMMQAALGKGEMVTYTCHAGMTEAVVPLFVDEELVGFVMPGQFRSQAKAPPISPYASKWRDEHGDDALQAEYEKTPVYREEKIETLLSMFQLLMEFIISNQLIHHKDYDLIQPVIEHIQDAPNQELTLELASKMVGRSPSTVSRLFKKVTGRSFKQYQVTYRLDLAAARLKAKPNHPVAEIALAVGYDDPLYFSRVFRKQFNCSPSEYRNQ